VLEIELPVLGDQIFAEGSVRLFAEEAVPFVFIDTTCGGQDAVGPEDDAAIADAAGEGRALLDQIAAETESAGGGIDEEEAEAGGFVRFG